MACAWTGVGVTNSFLTRLFRKAEQRSSSEKCCIQFVRFLRRRAETLSVSSVAAFGTRARSRRDSSACVQCGSQTFPVILSMPSPELHLSVGIATLRRAAWDTAVAAGTRALMGYPEVSRHAASYQNQSIFESVQNTAVIRVEMSLIAALPGPENSLVGMEQLMSGQLVSLNEKVTTYRTHLVL